jgi:hypothetical protein
MLPGGLFVFSSSFLAWKPRAHHSLNCLPLLVYFMLDTMVRNADARMFFPD